MESANRRHAAGLPGYSNLSKSIPSSDSAMADWTIASDFASPAKGSSPGSV